MTIHVDLALSKRIELAEGSMGARFVETRRKLFDHYDGSWISENGAIAIYDGPESPLTQTFGLGLEEAVGEESLDKMESFFSEHKAPVNHEVSPYAGPAFFQLLCRRNYRPIELSNVFIKHLVHNFDYDKSQFPDIQVLIANSHSMYENWTKVNSNAWSSEHPDIGQFLEQVGAVNEANKHTCCFVALYKDVPAAAGALTIQNGVAVLNGAATLPQFRKRGLQSALIQERLKFACLNRCDLAIIMVEVGSNSQHNAERNGFTLAYSRSKWRLAR